MQYKKDKYKSGLLNNTKWREIIYTLTKHLTYPIEVAYVDKEKYCIGFIPAESKLKDSYIADPGFCIGPTKYEHIYAIRIPHIKPYSGKIEGLKSITKKASENLIRDLENLGQLPIIVTDQYITIKGYSK